LGSLEDVRCLNTGQLQLIDHRDDPVRVALNRGVVVTPNDTAAEAQIVQWKRPDVDVRGVPDVLRRLCPLGGEQCTVPDSEVLAVDEDHRGRNLTIEGGEKTSHRASDYGNPRTRWLSSRR